jgi:hypothetical protein
MARTGKIVRKKDSLGRTFYWDKEAKKRVKKDAWARERERVRQAPKPVPKRQKPKPLTGEGRKYKEGDEPEDIEEPPPEVDVPEDIQVFDVDVEGYDSAD